MEANEAPERLYLSKNIYSTYLYQVPDPNDETAVEYTRSDVFVDKVVEFLRKECKGFKLREIEIQKFIEYMKGE